MTENKADLILKKNEKLEADNEKLKNEMSDLKSDTQDKEKHLNGEYEKLRIEQTKFEQSRKKIQTQVNKKVKAELEESQRQLEESYSRRWKLKQGYLKGLLIYGVVVTILEAVKSKVFITDGAEFIKGLVEKIIFLVKKDYEIAGILAKVSGNIGDEKANDLLYWIIVILFRLISVMIAVLAIRLMCKKISKHFEDNPVNYVFITGIMINMATMIYLGEFIKAKVSVNLVLIFVIVEFVIEGIRSYVKGCREARGLY